MPEQVCVHESNHEFDFHFYHDDEFDDEETLSWLKKESLQVVEERHGDPED